MDFRTTSNPDSLSKDDITKMILHCPICKNPWPEGKYVCENQKCGVKLRVEPKAMNWWMFYPKCNGWSHLDTE
ncbi:MAG: hypothetical protein ACTSUO_00885 [Candidatus Thorarchaeota archaeon]